MKKIIVFLFFIIIGLGCMYALKLYSTKQNSGTVVNPLPPSQFSLGKAPEDSLVGSLTKNGEVFFQSRTATQEAKIENQESMQQGESLETKDTGSATILFPNIFEVQMLPKTEVSLIQTLPENIVVSQNFGSATYTNYNNQPISIKNLDLLVLQNQGSAKISISSDLEIITVKILNGSARVAYDDLEYNSSVVTLEKGDTFRFSDSTKTGETF